MIRKLFNCFGMGTQRKSVKRKQVHRAHSGFRQLRLEALEDRRMLSAEADIVFLIDKSKSSGEEYTWIGDMVSEVGGLNDYLTDPLRDIDPRYGLIGFGNGGITGAGGYGFSHVLDINDTNSDGDVLFGTASQLDAVADNSIINNSEGSEELVWDSIEHAIAEHEFREGAAVIFVMFRRDDNGGSARLFAGNQPEGGGVQTHEGILAAMQSYNATLNSVVEAAFDPAMFGANGIVLGVEADETDNVIDGVHIAHVVNGIANQPTTPDFLQVCDRPRSLPFRK